MSLIEKLSPCESVQHEPFNVDRVYGKVSRNYQENFDFKQLADDIQGIVALRVNIKHCIELVPVPVTMELVEAAPKEGYRIVLWNRENQFLRVVSLFLAEQTGMWENNGRDRLARKLTAGLASTQPIPPAAFLKQSRNDATMWNNTIGFLEQTGIPFAYGTYENIYQPNPNKDHLISLLTQLGIVVAPDHPRIRAFVSARPERPSEIAESIPNIAKLRNIRLATCRAPSESAMGSIVRFGRNMARMLHR